MTERSVPKDDQMNEKNDKEDSNNDGALEPDADDYLVIVGGGDYHFEPRLKKRRETDDGEEEEDGGSDDAGGEDDGNKEMSYEERRRASIARNKEMLMSLGQTPQFSSATKERRHYKKRTFNANEKSMTTRSSTPVEKLDDLLSAYTPHMDESPSRFRVADFEEDSAYEVCDYPILPYGRSWPEGTDRSVRKCAIQKFIHRVVQHRIKDEESDTDLFDTEAEKVRDDTMTVYPEDDADEAALIIPTTEFLLRAEVPFDANGEIKIRRGRPPRERPVDKQEDCVFERNHTVYIMMNLSVPLGHSTLAFPDEEPVESVAWLPRINTCIAAAGGSEGSLAIYNVVSKKKFAFSGHLGAVVGVSFAYDGDYLMSVSADGSVRVLDIETGVSHPVISPEKKVERTACETENKSFTCHTTLSRNDGNSLLCGCVDGSVMLVDCRCPSNPQLFMALHTAAINQISMHPSSDNAFVTASDDQYCALWDLRMTEQSRTEMKNTCRSKKKSADLPGSLWSHSCDCAILSASFSPRMPSLFMTSTADCKIRLFNISASLRDTNGRSTFSSRGEKLLKEWSFPVAKYDKKTLPLRRYNWIQKHRELIQWDPYRPCVAMFCNKRSTLRPVGAVLSDDLSIVLPFDHATRRIPYFSTPTVCAFHPIIPNVLVSGDSSGNVLAWVPRYSMV